MAPTHGSEVDAHKTARWRRRFLFRRRFGRVASSAAAIRPACVTVLAAGILALHLLAATAVDPASGCVRVRLIVTSTAASFTITVANATIANVAAGITGGSAAIRTSSTTTVLQLTGNTPGQEVEAQFQTILVGVASGSSVSWTLSQTTPAHTQLEIYNLNQESVPALVDRFETDADTALFQSSAGVLRDRGPLFVSAVGTHFLLAHYYPWWDQSSWFKPDLIDRPISRYSTDDLQDVTHLFQLAKATGLDGMAVSWAGKDFEGGWNHRRMLIALEAARKVGLKITTLVETTVANPAHSQDGVPADPATVYEWLSDIINLYAPQPAYLQIDGRPVILPYAVRAMAPADWSAVISRLREDGHNPLIVGEDTRARFLAPIDGEWDYASNRFSATEIFGFDRDLSARVRTYHLLQSGNGARRIFAATVSPGYDDTHLSTYPSHRVTDRAGGAYYESQWNAALDSVPDWILITSWNEWNENTGIEPSFRYGDYYLRRTRYWANRFHTLARVTRTTANSPVVGVARPR